jgi:Ca2+-binding RTX toxin-like protein
MLLMPGRRSLAAVIVSLAMLVAPTVATPAGQIVVYGAASGSHLTLSTHGGHIVVNGNMAHQPPLGCHFTRGHDQAVCGTAGEAAIEVDMGPSGDLVQVEDALPISLTVHLGNGSDKFIGNAEQDTCYSEGSRRNRCIGGAGNDICITGQKNSDCVGDAGSDYCHTGAGSDGCWGGSGNDVCIMGPGQDGCHGEGGNDRLYGGPGADQLYGGGGFNFCDGLPGIGKSHECHAGPGH